MREDYKEALLIALKTLFLRDRELIQRQTWETSISAKLMAYLQPLFPDHDVDHEYNKHGDGPKLITAKAERTECSERPDIVIHRRRNDSQNLMVIEIKSKNRDAAGDFQKLKDLTDPSKDYKYEYGLHIHFSPAPEKIQNLLVYSNGLKNEHAEQDLKEFLKQGGVPVAW